MINKIVHFSDLHFRLFKDHDLYKLILTRALEEWKSIEPDRIVFTGDLVHSKNQMTPELIDIVTWLLEKCSEICETILLIGNHDFLENNLNRVDAISPILNSLKNEKITYYTETGVYSDNNIDWIVFSLKNGNTPPIVKESNNFKIGLFHGPVDGLKTDLGYEFNNVFDKNKFKGCDIVLCGDIHKRQVFKIPGGKAYMVGSLIQQNFGETVTKHGYGIYNVDENNYEFRDLDNPRPYFKFKINSIEDIENGHEEIINY
jgi:DNA repair exonuclease SbcCD nuclease subunit